MDYSYENNFKETKMDLDIELITKEKKKQNLYWNYDPFETRKFDLTQLFKWVE